MSHHGRNGFELTRKVVDGTIITSSEFTCAGCGSTLTKPLSKSGLIPEHEAKRARAEGWEADAFKASATRCPKCLKPPKNDPLADIKRLQNKEPKMTIQPAAVATIDPAKRDPNPQQRLAIRNKLDAQFDDAKGRYLNGYSDHRVAAELDLPRVFVEKIREAAYGPIKENPDLAQAMAEVASIREAIDALSKRHALVEAKIKTFL